MEKYDHYKTLCFGAEILKENDYVRMKDAESKGDNVRIFKINTIYKKIDKILFNGDSYLKAFTKGMDVVWRFTEVANGVLVEIVHDLKFRVPFLAPIAEPVIGDFFTCNVANKTLRCMKAYVEARANRVTA